MKRKTIALCVTGFDWEKESRIVDGVWRTCLDKDINLLIFVNLLRKQPVYTERPYSESILNGESEIFDLINYDLVDGVLILGDTMIRESIIDEVADRAEAKNVPVINVADPDHPLDHNILLSDRNAMELCVRHLVEEHGLTKINFIGGFPGNYETEIRLAAYKKVLEEHGIPFEEKRVGYGRFWRKAYDVTEDFLKEGDLPEAIACASDMMAFFCMDCLKSHGYRIPEDIIVTGFDGIKESELYSPTLTTSRHAYGRAGVEAVKTLERIWAGEEVSRDLYVESELITRQSCGCVPKKDRKEDFYGEQVAFRTRNLEFNHTLIDMNTRLAAAENSEELFADCISGADFFYMKNLYVCISSYFEKSEDDGISADTTRIAEDMVCMLDRQGKVPVRTEFRSKDLVPIKNFLDGEKMVFMAFSPLYYRDDIMGYLAYEPSYVGGSGDLFTTWVLNIANNAGSFYMKNQLKYVVKKLENLYVRDPLTELYNRRGMNSFGEDLVADAVRKNSTITVFSVDIDDLKPINDNYGHQSGDNAICRAALSIKTAMPDESVCCRTGGDEFVVISSRLEKGMEKQYIESIEKKLNSYNNESGMPYKVSCSCGFYTVDGSKFESLEKMITLADIEMYKSKTAKKAGRC